MRCRELLTVFMTEFLYYISSTNANKIYGKSLVKVGYEAMILLTSIFHSCF